MAPLAHGPKQPSNQLWEDLISRRSLLKRTAALGISMPALSALLAACGDDDRGSEDDTAAGESDDEPTPDEVANDDTSSEEPSDEDETVDSDEEDDTSNTEASGEGQRGGTLNYAMIGEPPMLDTTASPAFLVGVVGWNFYEALFSFDSEYQVIPMLAESHEVSDDGLTNTIYLREGVPFHNGDQMTAADVVASIERWGELAANGQSLVEATSLIEAVDDYTVEFQMEEPYGILVPALAQYNNGCPIFPKSVLDEVGTEPIPDEQIIGTGPYRFVEHLADQHILAERFEDYAALDGEPNGYGGHKNQYLDEIRFVPVPDEAARVAGLQSGDYDFLDDISPDQFGTLEDDPNVQAEVLPPGSWASIQLNWRSPLIGDLKIRQAVQAALDHEPMLQAAYGEGFYRLDPSIMFQETAWHTTAGEEHYNINDPELARQYLEEAGYDGTPIRFMVTQEYQDHFNYGMVAVQQLEEVGFGVEVEVYDWATLTERRTDDTAWDLFITTISFRPDPIMVSMMQLCVWPGWWCSEESMELLEMMRRESEFEARFGYFEQLQENFYTEIPMIKVGDAFDVAALSARVRGFTPQIQLGPMLWNVWLED